MAELDTFAKLISAVHEILPDAVIEAPYGELVIHTNLREVDGKLEAIPEEAEEVWMNSEEFDAWLKGENL